MTPGVIWQLAGDHERGGRAADQAHAHLAARLHRLFHRRRRRR